jgi:hypothetical protein
VSGNGGSSAARRMWVRFETYHDVTYFTPESRAAADALGCKGGWMGYFAMRAAPLGAASPESVASAFYNFRPTMVARAVPDCWRVASPEVFLQTRLAGVDGALRRLLGATVVAGPDMAEAASLAVEAAGHAPTAGRPLAAANARLPMPEPVHLALWQATTVLRESRGDGHVAALVAADLAPLEALVLFAAERGLDPEYLQKARGWTAEQWQEARQRLIQRGLLDEPGVLAPSGMELRQWVEERTDAGAAHPWDVLGPDRTGRLAELLTPMTRTLAAGNEIMRVNPMALDATRLLAA